MISTNIRILFILSIFIVTGWSTAYVPDGEYGGFDTGGYTNYMIDANTAVVAFHGGSGDNARKIKRYALYRCAQVAMNNGYQYFIVVSSSNSGENVNIKSKTKYRQISPPGRSVTADTYPTARIQSVSTSGTKSSNCDLSDVSVCKTHAITFVIKMFDKMPPQNTPNVYMVADVLSHDAP